MLDFSAFIFLSAVMVAFGYMAGNAENFNKWKFALLALILVPFFIEFNLGKAHLITMLVAFGIGFFLPYAWMLEDFRDAISDAINSIRYRDAYEDIKRREAEVEELRRKYEEERREAFRKQQEWERKRRQEEAEQFRQRQREEEQKSKQKSGQQHSHKRQEQNQKQQQRRSYSSWESQKRTHLQTLGLDPDGDYAFGDIKKAYRKMAMKVHPDRYQNEPENIRKEMEEKFKKVNAANAWLGENWK